MCVVSFVSDAYGSGGLTNPRWYTNIPPTMPWTPDTLEEFKKILARLDELDKKLGQAECKDPEKGKWIKAIEKRLKALEGRK